MSRPLRQQWLFFYLYFFEGAPIGLLWWTLPTLLSESGEPVDVITRLTAFTTLPWAFKFLLGPFVDRYIVRERSYAWTVGSLQSGLLVSLFLLVRSGLDSSYLWLTVFGISFFSAIQDVVIDAWAMASVKESQRGRVNGAMQAGMLTGRWIFGAGLLILIQWMPWERSIELLSLLLLMSILSLFWGFKHHNQEIGPKVSRLDFKSLSFIFESKFLKVACIALLSGFALKSLGTVIGPFLIENAFRQDQVGWVLSATLGLMLVGSLHGGFTSDKQGPASVFLVSGLFLAMCVPLAGAFGIWLGQSGTLMTVLVTYLIIGYFIASSYTFYMNRSAGPMEATKFTYLMAMTNLCESGSAYLTGAIAQKASYLPAFGLASLISLVGLYLLYRQREAIF